MTTAQIDAAHEAQEQNIAWEQYVKLLEFYELVEE